MAGTIFPVRQWKSVHAKRGLSSTIEFSGAFFAHDPASTMDANIGRALQLIAADGEKTVQAYIAALPLKHSTGWTRSHIVGRTQSLAGKPWHRTVIVSPSTVGMDRTDAIRTMAAAASIERIHHVFRRVTSALKKAEEHVRNELLKGLA